MSTNHTDTAQDVQRRAWQDLIERAYDTGGIVVPNRPVSPWELRALVTVETAERIAAAAVHAIDAGDPGMARRLLAELVDATTTHTVSAVKRQPLSDAIIQEAARRSRQVVERVAPALMQEPQPDPEPPQVLITPELDPQAADDEELFWHVMMVCPHDGCESVDDIYADERGSIWRPITYDLGPRGTLYDLPSGLVMGQGRDGEDETAGYLCGTCGKPVSLPADLVEEMSYT